MTRKEHHENLKWARSLSNKELLKEYHDTLRACCDSQVEDMYELGYDMSDIEDRAEYEDYTNELNNILSRVCGERNIHPFEDYMCIMENDC